MKDVAPPLYAHCIICHDTVELTDNERKRLDKGFTIKSKVCDKCRGAIMYIRNNMEENQNNE